MKPISFKEFFGYYSKKFIWLVIGSMLAAIGIQVFLIPNHLVDGGTVGIAMMISHFFGHATLPYFLVLLNLPFVLLAYKQIGKLFVIQMITAILLFSLFTAMLDWIPIWFHTSKFEFHGEILELIVLGGFIIGCGVGIIIKAGGSTDGTEILAILIQKKRGFTVGQVILFVNIFIFAIAGLTYKNWHSAFVSLMTYVVVTKMIDMVLVGLEDTKSVMIISSHPQKLAEAFREELGLSLTIMYGRGGYSGEAKEILYIVVERLQLAQLKALVLREDPQAFVAIENLHEAINSQHKTPHSFR